MSKTKNTVKTGISIDSDLLARCDASIPLTNRKLMNKGRVERIESKDQPKGLSAKTVRNINQVISSAMDFSVAQKIISENPCKAVALPKVEHKEMQTIPAEQLQAFLKEAKDTL